MTVTRRPTELLKADHQEVLKKLDTLEHVVGGLDEPDAIVSDLRELGRFFKTEIWDHFQKEEEALFPEIEKFLPREKGPTKQMLREHEDLREANERFQRGIGGYFADSDDGQAVALVQDTGQYIINLLRNHIHKEDNVLFKMADMHLSQAQDQQILDVFEAIETERA